MLYWSFTGQLSEDLNFWRTSRDCSFPPRFPKPSLGANPIVFFSFRGWEGQDIELGHDQDINYFISNVYLPYRVNMEGFCNGFHCVKSRLDWGHGEASCQPRFERLSAVFQKYQCVNKWCFGRAISMPVLHYELGSSIIVQVMKKIICQRNCCPSVPYLLSNSSQCQTGYSVLQLSMSRDSTHIFLQGKLILIFAIIDCFEKFWKECTDVHL